MSFPVLCLGKFRESELVPSCVNFRYGFAVGIQILAQCCEMERLEIGLEPLRDIKVQSGAAAWTPMLYVLHPALQISPRMLLFKLFFSGATAVAFTVHLLCQIAKHNVVRRTASL